MTNLLPHHSPSSKRFSREKGFQPLPADQVPIMSGNDATIDIPLEQVQSNGQGIRREGSSTALRVDSMNKASHKRALFRGRRHKPDPNARGTGKVGYDGEEDEVNTMGKIYRKIVGFSAFTRYFLYILPVGGIIAVPIIIAATNSDARKAKIGGVRILWFFTWVEIIWLSLWISKIVAHYLPYIFRVLMGVVSSGVRKYSMVIRALEIQLSLVGWAVTSLATFKPLMTNNPDFSQDCALIRADNAKHPTQTPQQCQQDWIDVVQKILAASLFGTLIYFAEKFFIQLISINYHRKQFNSRIKESKHNIWILGLLYDASRELFPMYCNEFAEEDYVIADQLNLSRSSAKNTKSHTRSGSHTPIRVLQDIGHAADKVTSMFGHVASEVTGKEVFNPNSAHSIVVEALEKTRTAEALARRVWMSFVVEGREALFPEDVEDVLGANRKAEAEEAFWTFDQDGNGDISLDEFILTVTQFGRDRKSIASSMHDVDQAINVLDKLLVFVALIIIVLIFVAFLNKSFTTTLATTGTALLSLSFVFAATAQEVLGSCIFLFVKHPFDIGDRVDIGTSGCTNQEQFVVEKISLLFCVFRHVQGVAVGRICQIPNIVLNTLWIENISRSKAMTEQLTIDVAFDTKFDDLQILKNELLNFVTEKDNSREFLPTVDLDILGTSDQSKMSLMVEVKHKSNWANENVRRTRRSKFMCALVSALKAVPVYPPGGGCDVAGSAALPSYSVAISQSEAKEYADAAAQDREKARLVPTKKLDDAKQSLSPTLSKDSNIGAGMTQRDALVVDSIANRDPAISVNPTGDEWNRDDNSSTLDERTSMERMSLDEVRGVLRRESTRGKRKVSHDNYNPNIPTINEPIEQYPNGAPPQVPAFGFENQRPTYSTTPASYRPPVTSQQPMPQYQQSPYQNTQMAAAAGQAVQMSQIAPGRSPSNPYRPQKVLTPADEKEEQEWGGARPYSGV